MSRADVRTIYQGYFDYKITIDGETQEIRNELLTWWTSKELARKALDREEYIYSHGQSPFTYEFVRDGIRDKPLRTEWYSEDDFR